MIHMATHLTRSDVLASPFRTSALDLEFSPDELGPGFGYHHIEMGHDPDGESPVRCTLVRYRPDTPGESDAEFAARPAIFFVHGMTDYFFQAHVAEHFHSQGYAVYGVDLRKCGRSWREGQTWHHVTDQSLYDEDLSITLALLATAHPTVVASGHSTGGLDVTMWAQRLFDAAQANPSSPEAQLHARLDALVLNSPWFGLQFGAATRFIINNIFPTLGRLRPTQILPGGINPVYGRSLHASEAGEWDYNLELKPLLPRPKYVSWIAGVAREIKQLHSGRGDTGVPTLILTSHTHHFSTELSYRSFAADLILMPRQMWANARNASRNSDVVVIEGALHDIFLSRPRVRERALAATDEWLQDVLTLPRR